MKEAKIVDGVGRKRRECRHDLVVDIGPDPEWFEWVAPHLTKVIGMATSDELTVLGYAWQASPVVDPKPFVWPVGPLQGFAFGGSLYQGGKISLRLSSATPKKVTLAIHCLHFDGDCK